MYHYELLDRFLVTLALPIVPLIAALSICAVRKKCLPWPLNQSLNQPVLIDPSGQNTNGVQSFLDFMADPKALLPSYLAAFCIGSLFFILPFVLGLIAVDEEAFHWGCFPFPAVLWPLGLCTLAPLPFFAICQLLVFGSKSIPSSDLRKMQARYFAGLALASFMLLTAVPLTQYWLALVHASPVPACVSLESARMAMPLSIIPTFIYALITILYNAPELEGIYVRATLSRAFTNYRLLNNSKFRKAQLESLSSEKLVSLIEIANHTNQTAVAEEIHEHLSKRLLAAQDH
jgi:hypothetical protein